jgi:hypothetical protein
VLEALVSVVVEVAVIDWTLVTLLVAAEALDATMEEDVAAPLAVALLAEVLVTLDVTAAAVEVEAAVALLLDAVVALVAAADELVVAVLPPHADKSRRIPETRTVLRR